MRNIDKFRGCLIGGAVGDALGYAVEFIREDQIFSQYGKSGITEYSLRNGIAEISDDTQMTLFTANGLLYETTRKMTRATNVSYTDSIQAMYKYWYKTQTKAYPLNDKYLISWLMNIPELFSRRAPGITCLTALESDISGTIKNPINDSKGCGGVMRVAPVGLYFCDSDMSIPESDMIAAEAAAITHGHELGYIPAAAFAHIVRKIAENDNASLKFAVLDSNMAVKNMFPHAKYLEYYTSLIEKAVELADSDIDDLIAIHQLGEGWIAEEALAIAVYCALRYENDFEKAIIASVNHNGDSDSTGSIAGNILGAHLGYKNIPQKFKDKLELHDVIIEIADDLCNDCKIGKHTDYSDDVWKKKYIYASYPN